MIGLALQVVLALLYANFIEWFVHKYFLHKLGARPKSPLAFHWRRHHRQARQQQFLDTDYMQPIYRWNARTKEVLGLGFVVALHIPVVFFFPVAFGAMVLATVAYYYVHKQSHMNPAWAKKWVPWHYDHHMGKNQHANYNVTYPLFDYVFGTRIKYFTNE